MLNRFALQHGLPFTQVDHAVELAFLLILLLLLAATWALRKPWRWWASGAVLCLALWFALPWLLHPIFGPWPGMDDGPAEAARLRITLQQPRKVGPFLFPPGAVLQYWTEGRDELDWVDLPGPSAVLPGVSLTGHMSQWHAVSGWTVHLAHDEIVTGMPCSMAGSVILNPENGQLMGCDLTQPTRIKGWLCTNVWFETDGRLRDCGADPEQIRLPSGTYPAGSGWSTYDEQPENANVEAGKPLTFNQPLITWTVKDRVTVDFLNQGASIDRARTTPGEPMPFRGNFLGGVIEWQYEGLLQKDRYQGKSVGPVRALRGQLSVPLQCASEVLPPLTQVEIPTQGNDVKRWPPDSDWVSLKEEDAVAAKGCSLNPKTYPIERVRPKNPHAATPPRP